MPFRIQRVPRGLNELLSIFGGNTPNELEDRVRASLDVLQMYGIQQRQTFTASNAALAEATDVSNTPSTNWIVLFQASITITKTATMTALNASIGIRYNGNVNEEETLAASANLGPFGATETGLVTLNYVAPYPRLLPPRTQFVGRMGILGTDATASVFIGANYGVLG